MLTIDGRQVAPLRVARSRWERARGLLGVEDPEAALWLPRVRSVHTVGMSIPIDVAWVDGSGRVRHVRCLRPGRVSGWRRAAGVLEAEAGAFARWALVPGARVGGLGQDRPRA